MNATIESLFGPPSEPIDIPAFIQSAAALDHEEPVVDSSVAEECSVADIRSSLSDAWNNPNISAHLSNNHDYMLMSLYSTTKPSKSKRKFQSSQSTALPSEVAELQADLDAVKLSSSKLTLDSSTFIRPSKISDQNVLTQVALTPSQKVTPEPSAHLSEEKNAIITLTVHNRSSWTSGYGYINRSSQHVLLSSQTLGDIYKVMPCISNEMVLDEESEHGDRNDVGCVICVDNTVYGDGYGEEDYAHRKLLNHLQTVTKDAPSLDKASTTIYETLLSSLKLRINYPYWLLHKGNCEHFLVVDQIR
ncbi:hypothetical protein H0H92_008339 [Tricholoma furcatifolium]|nr:hypothetical protein H0H92_008339 [Tricholoma furcatifolium]